MQSNVSEDIVSVICKSRNLCTGCSVCKFMCPQSCIDMVQDNEGFYYPQVDVHSCIKCHICERSCPVNEVPITNPVRCGFVVRHNDESVVSTSTSGGISTALIDYTISRGGIFFGAAYDRDFVVRHIAVSSDCIEEAKNIRGSKYVQSQLGDAFPKIRRLLNNSVPVVFVGTPCQVAGLQAYLGRDYRDLLLTVDFVCHGVSSPSLFEAYLEGMAKKSHSDVVDVRFRNKTYGYHSSTMRICFANGRSYHGSARIDPMMRAYFSGAASRESCYECPFKGMARCSDLTVFDAWHAETIAPQLRDDDKGYTNVFVRTKTGLTALCEMDSLLKVKGDVELMRDLDGSMIYRYPEKHASRPFFIRDSLSLGIDEAINRYNQVSMIDKLIEIMKSVSHKFGVLQRIKERIR